MVSHCPRCWKLEKVLKQQKLEGHSTECQQKLESLKQIWKMLITHNHEISCSSHVTKEKHINEKSTLNKEYLHHQALA